MELGEIRATGPKDWLAEQVIKCGDVDVDKKRKMWVKYEHSFKVAEMAENIAEGLNMSPAEVSMAYVCGLLHDAGRFKQVAEYNTFWDSKSVDHGDLGADMILEGVPGLTQKQIDVVSHAVRYHNKFRIPITDDFAETMLRVVRDADKVDIFRVYMDHWSYDGTPEGTISDEYVQKMMREDSVRYEDTLSEMEIRSLYFTWVYDINYLPTVEVLLENRYMERLAEKLPECENVNIMCDMAVKKLLALREEWSTSPPRSS